VVVCGVGCGGDGDGDGGGERVSAETGDVGSGEDGRLVA
jgi:hypothetical protein